MSSTLFQHLAQVAMLFSLTLMNLKWPGFFFSFSHAVEEWLNWPTVWRALAINTLMLFSDNSESLIISWSVWIKQGAEEDSNNNSLHVKCIVAQKNVNAIHINIPISPLPKIPRSLSKLIGSGSKSHLGSGWIWNFF